MSTVIQYTKEYPTVELTYGSDFISATVTVTAGGLPVDLSGYDLLWQFRTGKSQDSDLIASLARTGSTPTATLTVNGPAGTLVGFVPFSLIEASELAPNTKIWHDLRVRDSLFRTQYWWRGVILLVTGVTVPRGV